MACYAQLGCRITGLSVQNLGFYFIYFSTEFCMSGYFS